MTKEKELLLRDLSARLPYNVLVSVSDNDDDSTVLTCDTILTVDILKRFIDGKIDIKPYLRPLSSMTDEEIDALYKSLDFGYVYNNYKKTEEFRSFKESIKNNDLFIPYPRWIDDYLREIDWLYKNQFDINKLLKKKLALEAPETYIMYIKKFF